MKSLTGIERELTLVREKRQQLDVTCNNLQLVKNELSSSTSPPPPPPPTPPPPLASTMMKSTDEYVHNSSSSSSSSSSRSNTASDVYNSNAPISHASSNLIDGGKEHLQKEDARVIKLGLSRILK